jgi:hypothetical protein
MSEEDFQEYYTSAESEALFRTLFPAGFSGEDVLREIAPEGWTESTLHFVFHPIVDQIHWECVRLHRNLRRSLWGQKQPIETPEPTLQDICADHEDSPIETAREVGQLVAMCLWDVFSNENDVVDRDGRLVDIGSWRGAAGFLAEQLNCERGVQQYDYMDFYMGTVWVSERADLTPVYEMIFGRLKGRLLDWRYRLPELKLIDFPSDEVCGQRSNELEKMKKELKQAHRLAMEDLKLEPVPAIVLAYQNVYGISPHGWPPWEFEEGED